MGQALSPETALERMRVPDDLEVELVLAEPVVRQPVSLSFDERGRMWVVQYLQYPSGSGGSDHAQPGRRLAGRALTRVPDELAAAMEQYGEGSVILGLRRGLPQALDEALRRIVDPAEDSSLRLQYARILGEVHPPAAMEPLVRLATAASDSALQSVAIAALEGYSDRRHRRCPPGRLRQHGRRCPADRAVRSRAAAPMGSAVSR